MRSPFESAGSFESSGSSSLGLAGYCSGPPGSWGMKQMRRCRRFASKLLKRDSDNAYGRHVLGKVRSAHGQRIQRRADRNFHKHAVWASPSFSSLRAPEFYSDLRRSSSLYDESSSNSVKSHDQGAAAMPLHFQRIGRRDGRLGTKLAFIDPKTKMYYGIVLVKGSSRRDLRQNVATRSKTDIVAWLSK